jgi:hypothetical protein
MKFYIEKLTVWSLVIICWTISRKSEFHKQNISLSYIDGSDLAIFITKIWYRMKGWEVSQLLFKYIDIREDGSKDLIGLLIHRNYLINIKKQLLIQYSDVFQPLTESIARKMFIEKMALSKDPR